MVALACFAVDGMHQHGVNHGPELQEKQEAAVFRPKLQGLIFMSRLFYPAQNPNYNVIDRRERIRPNRLPRQSPTSPCSQTTTKDSQPYFCQPPNRPPSCLETLGKQRYRPRDVSSQSAPTLPRSIDSCRGPQDETHDTVWRGERHGNATSRKVLEFRALEQEEPYLVAALQFQSSP